MAAFINALSEEGTREDVLRWVMKIRAELGMITPIEDYYNAWSKKDLLYELVELWDKKCES